jgi:hypothetical protein
VASKIWADRFSCFVGQALELLEPLEKQLNLALRGRQPEREFIQDFQEALENSIQEYGDVESLYFDGPGNASQLIAGCLNFLGVISQHPPYVMEEEGLLIHDKMVAFLDRLRAIKPESYATESCSITLRSAWNSSLHAVGAVTVTDARRGCYDCKVKAQSVVIEGPVRRCRVVSRTDIRIYGEVGSPLTEEEVVLETSEAGQIELESANPGVVLIFGSSAYRVDEPLGKRLFFLDPNSNTVVNL